MAERPKTRHVRLTDESMQYVFLVKRRIGRLQGSCSITEAANWLVHLAGRHLADELENLASEKPGRNHGSGLAPEPPV